MQNEPTQQQKDDFNRDARAAIAKLEDKGFSAYAMGNTALARDCARRIKEIKRLMY